MFNSSQHADNFPGYIGEFEEVDDRKIAHGKNTK